MIPAEVGRFGPHVLESAFPRNLDLDSDAMAACVIDGNRTAAGKFIRGLIDAT
jgi:hypothetical protein